MGTAPRERAWWKDAVVYQLYPRSYNDTDDDGLGDLPGILERIDHLDELGVDAVWLNPIYDSPFADGGYDVRDYRSLHRAFGNMEDFYRLRDELHRRGIRLIMDLVVNHTSDEHPWFRRARQNSEGPYRDRYVWRDGEPGRPPNNWESAFGGSAWTYDDSVGAYYLHLFHEKQPDLNWSNPDLRNDVYDMMRWWLDRGIDGFRMDVINLISKPDDLPDGNPDLPWVGVEHFANGPNLIDHLTEMDRRVLSDYQDLITVGECVAAGVKDASDYVRPNGPLSMVFHFDHVMLDVDLEAGWGSVREWDLPELKEVFTRWQHRLDGWNGLHLGNHDGPRAVSRFGNDGRHRTASAKLLATFLLTMPGTPFLYQGDEIGMTNYPFEGPEEIEDPETLGRVQQALEREDVSFEDLRDVLRARCRDNARTPMQWTDEPNAGFTGGDPWLPVNPNHTRINVAQNREDPDSVFHHCRRLIELRRQVPVLPEGDYRLWLPEHPSLYVYTVSRAEREILVLLNWSDEETPFEPPAGLSPGNVELLIANRDVDRPLEATSRLRLWEARVYGPGGRETP